jgi:hypothetical protein
VFLSPIGDGVVAADGIELKRGPVDLTPKVEIIQQRIVEKGPSGQAGIKVTERTWTSGGGGSESQATNQSSVTGGVPPQSIADAFGSGSGLPSTNAGLSSGVGATPQSTAPLQNNTSPFGGLSDPLGLGPTGFGSGAPTSAAPSNNFTKPLNDLVTASAPASNYNSLGSHAGTDPYGTLASLRSGPGAYDCEY